MIIFHFTIFLSALLLFQVQLLMGKFLLPWFGGTAATWTVCLLFYQGVLLGGYLYAHGVGSRLSLRMQRYMHALVAGASFVALLGFAWISGTPLLPDASWRSDVNAFPALQITGLLAATVGFPCFVLSTTSPLLQRWYAMMPGSGSPYKLYALSNAGSLIGLVSYPLLLEPRLTLQAQASTWFFTYALFTAGIFGCLAQIRRATPAAAGPSEAPAVRDPAVLWFLLSACGAVMLYATTNMVCQDVASVPFLWVVPLVVYLVTFIICFEGSGGYSRRWGIPVFSVATVLACAALFLSTDLSVPAQVGAFAFVLFAACMVCHGELYLLKPGPARLTRFYLTTAAGGVCGGALVALVAPLVLKGFWEYHAGLWLSWFLLSVSLARDRQSSFHRGLELAPFLLVGGIVLFASFLVAPFWNAWPGGSPPPLAMALHYAIAASIALGLFIWIDRRPADSWFHKSRAGWVRYSFVSLLVLLQVVLMVHMLTFLTSVVSVTRNFYGTLRVADRFPDDPQQHRFSLYHGRIMHGSQLVEPSLRRVATSYYSEKSGFGIALSHHPRRAAGRPLRIGVVGLGVGTVAASARQGDSIRFYEINPAVVRMAIDSPWFTFVKDCPVTVDIVEGDGRLMLERELKRDDPPFDVLAIDAFSGDAVPMHLLTREAFAIYLRRINALGGVIAVNISNRFIDLKPVVQGAALALGCSVLTVENIPSDERFASSTWVLISGEAPFSAELQAAAMADTDTPLDVKLWTDDFSDLLGVIK